MKNNKEIERVWLIPSLPSKEMITHSIPHIISYLFSNEMGEMRVVKRMFGAKGNLYSLTVKSKGMMSRDEWEDDDIPEWVYNILHSKSDFGVFKTRHFVEHENYILEIDEYHSRYASANGFNLNGKIRMECEFSSEEEAYEFQLPSWASNALEVTHDTNFRNAVVAKIGWPDEC